MTEHWGFLTGHVSACWWFSALRGLQMSDCVTVTAMHHNVTPYKQTSLLLLSLNCWCLYYWTVNSVCGEKQDVNMKELMKQILVCEEADLSAEDSGFFLWFYWIHEVFNDCCNHGEVSVWSWMSWMNKRRLKTLLGCCRVTSLIPGITDNTDWWLVLISPSSAVLLLI